MDLIWILIRDLHLTRIETAGTPRLLYLNEVEDLTRFYEINEVIDENVIFEVADAFAETAFFKENVNNLVGVLNAQEIFLAF